MANQTHRMASGPGIALATAALILAGLWLCGWLNEHVSARSIGPGQFTVFGICWRPDAYIGTMGIVILLFLVLRFHAVRQQSHRVRVLCGTGAMLLGALSFLMAGLFLLGWFSI